jgi:hypothetical protein
MQRRLRLRLTVRMDSAGGWRSLPSPPGRAGPAPPDRGHRDSHPENPCLRARRIGRHGARERTYPGPRSPGSGRPWRGYTLRARVVVRRVVALRVVSGVGSASCRVSRDRRGLAIRVGRTRRSTVVSRASATLATQQTVGTCRPLITWLSEAVDTPQTRQTSACVIPRRAITAVRFADSLRQASMSDSRRPLIVRPSAGRRASAAGGGRS